MISIVLSIALSQPYTMFAADELAIDSHFESINLAPYAEYYEAISNSETIEDILQMADTNWSGATQNELSFGITNSSYWIRIRLASLATSDQLLAIEKNNFDQLEMYVVKDNAILYNKRSELVHPYPLFPVVGESDRNITIYLKASDSGFFRLPLRLWQTESFYQTFADQQLLGGTYLGIWLTILMVNLGFYSFTRHKLVASFLGIIFFLGAHWFSSSGSANILWRIISNKISEDVSMASLGIGLIFLCDFSIRFMHFHTRHATAERILQLLAIFCFITVLGYTVLPLNTILLTLTLLTIMVCGTVLLLGIIHSINGSRTALYATTAWSLLLAGMIARSVNILGFIPASKTVDIANQAGYFLMIGVLTFVIIRELRQTGAESRTSRQGLPLHDIMSSVPVLESGSSISDRTKELESALEELSQANDTLREYNTIDSLTGVKNRRYFDNNYQPEWRRAFREKYTLSLLLIDVDHFKSINDEFGHLAGDECLKSIAKAISSVIKRPGDILARYGGEEFIIVLPYITNQSACLLASEIHHRIQRMRLKIDNREISVTISIGVCSTTPTDTHNSKYLISMADDALYEAKNNGRNQIRNAGVIVSAKSQTVS